MELISVIVPVYKVEPYLDRCIQSIVDQTYRDLEIILVDDGSPDNCGAMCDTWAEKDSRIRVVHKENGGLSDARNAGMAVATGEYIGFVDSDDWLSPEFYRVLMQTMSEHGCDIVCCGFLPTSEPVPDTPIPAALPVRLMNAQEAMRELIRDSAVRQVVWNKLYRRELIRDIPYAVGKYHEDEFWSYQVIGRSQKLAVVDFLGYYYFQRSGSIMGESFSVKRLDAIEAKCLRHAYILEQFPDLAGFSQKSIIGSCLYLNQLAIRTADKEAAVVIQTETRTILKKYPLDRNTMSVFSVKERIWLGLAVMNMPLTCRIRNLLKIGL